MKRFALLFATALLAVSGALAAPLKTAWQEVAPAPEAVARPFAGLLEGKLIVAGGSTHDGTTKQAVSAIRAFDVEAKTWQELGSLPEGVAEGGSAVVSLPVAGGTKPALLCVGGVTAKGATASAFLLRADGSREELPPCPYGTLSMTASAGWDKGAYFAGGYLNGKPTNRVFSLKLENGKWTWGELPPLPGVARVQAVAAVQNGDQKHPVLVVYGGSALAEDGKPMAVYDGYAYGKDGMGVLAWRKLDAAPVATIGAAFLPIGDQHILLIGGYNGSLWDRANRMSAEAWAQEAKTKAPQEFGWNTKLYAFHAVTGRWSEYGALGEGMLPRCGAAAAVVPGASGGMPSVVVAGGEVKPGARTTSVEVATFTRQGWRFGWGSWLVIALFFLSMLGMGVYFAFKEKTADSYFRGGKSLPWYVVGVSIYATMLSSITFISIPTMTYISDWRYFPMALCILAMAPVAIYFYLPFFCRLNITSAYEYLEQRFNLGIRLFGAAVFNIFMICRVAVVTLLPAIALGAVTGMPIWVAILLCGVATIAYCFFGGVEAVVWCDFVQGLILLCGAIVVMLALIMGSGGFGEFANVAWQADKFRMWDFRFLFDQPVFWVVVIMGLVSNLNSYTADQCIVQRYITCPDEKAAGRSIWFNGILSVVSSVIFYLIGTALYTHYVKHPELMDITMPKSDSIFPIFMAIELHPVIAGLIVASIFAATISTLATNLNSSATSIVIDFFARFRKEMSGDAQVLWGRWCVVAVGGLGVLAALILSVLPSRSLFDTFQNFIGTLTGGLSALFLLGVFFPRVGGAAAMIALVVNYIISLGIGFVYEGLHPFTYGGIALAVCVVLAWVLSFVFPNTRSAEGLTHFSKPKEN